MATSVGATNWNIEVVGQVGGGCLGVTAKGNYAYVGEGPNLTILNVSTTPTVVEKVRFQGIISDVFLSGNLVYVAGWTAGLKIVNVSDPLNPRVIGSYPGAASYVHVRDNKAYVAMLGNVKILNVAQPTTPVLLGNINTAGYVTNVWASGAYAYLANPVQGLQVYNVGVPSTPVLRLTYPQAQLARDVATSGSLAFVAGKNLYVVDLRNLSAPTLLASHSTWGPGVGICLRGSRAYIATTSGTLHIVDVSKPSAPKTLGVWWGTIVTEGVYVDGNTAYVTDWYRGLYVLDVSDPTSPIATGFYPIPVGSHVVRVAGSRAHLAAYDFYAIDVNDPQNPEVASIYPTPHELMGVDVSGNLAFLTHDVELDLLILNIGDPSHPWLEGTYSPDQTNRIKPVPSTAPYTYPKYVGPKVDVRGNVAVVSGFSSGSIELVNIGQPASPKRFSLFSLPGLIGEIAIQGNTAYFANGGRGLKILDISDSGNPRLQGTLSGIWALSFHASLESAQIGDGREGIWLANVSQPTSPTTISRYRCPGPTYGVDENGYLVYTASALNGLHVVNIARPTSPTLCGHFDSYGLAVDVRYHGGLIYLADRFTGLWILRYTGPQPGVTTPVSRQRWWHYQ